MEPGRNRFRPRSSVSGSVEDLPMGVRAGRKSLRLLPSGPTAPLRWRRATHWCGPPWDANGDPGYQCRRQAMGDLARGYWIKRDDHPARSIDLRSLVARAGRGRGLSPIGRRGRARGYPCHVGHGGGLGSLDPQGCRGDLTVDQVAPYESPATSEPDSIGMPFAAGARR
jgi:hypothetical protein